MYKSHVTFAKSSCTLHDKLAHSNLKLTGDTEWGDFPHRRCNSQMCNDLKLGKNSKITVTGKTYKKTFILIVTT